MTDPGDPLLPRSSTEPVGGRRREAFEPWPEPFEARFEALQFGLE